MIFILSNFHLLRLIQESFETELHALHPFTKLRIFAQILHQRKSSEPTKPLIYFLEKSSLRKIQDPKKPLDSLTLVSQRYLLAYHLFFNAEEFFFLHWVDRIKDSSISDSWGDYPWPLFKARVLSFAFLLSLSPASFIIFAGENYSMWRAGEHSNIISSFIESNSLRLEI